MLRVGHCITDHVLQEHLEHAARFLVDKAADALDTAAARQAANGRLGDACVACGRACRQSAWLSRSRTGDGVHTLGQAGMQGPGMLGVAHT